MPIDPSIAMGYRGIQLNDPLEQYTKAAALSQMAQQSQHMQSKMDAEDKATRLSDLRGKAYMDSGGDPAKIRAAMMSNGDYEGLMAHDKSQADILKSNAELDKTKAQTQESRNKAIGTGALIGYLSGTMEGAQQSANFFRNNGHEDIANGLESMMQQHPDASPDQIKGFFKQYLPIKPEHLMPKYESNGATKGNINPFATAPDIKLQASPDTVMKEQGDNRRAAMDKATSPYVEFLPTAGGYMIGNKRTGIISAPPTPVIPAKYDPKLQGDLAGATNTATMETKRDYNMKGIGEVITEAENILSGKGADGTSAPLPTGSGVGTAVDYAGSLVGANPSGSVQAQQLKALSGALTAKMPRMEGPQSDKDVQMYKEMAALIGDSTVPVARRNSALATVKKLWGKYEKKGVQAPPANNGWSIRAID